MRASRVALLLIALLAPAVGATLAQARIRVLMRDGLLYKPHVDHTYAVQVKLGRRTYCAGLHRIVYDKIKARIVGPNPGVFGGRTLGRVYTCAGNWQLTAGDRAATATGRAATDRAAASGPTVPRTRASASSWPGAASPGTR